MDTCAIEAVVQSYDECARTEELSNAIVITRKVAAEKRNIFPWKFLPVLASCDTAWNFWQST